MAKDRIFVDPELENLACRSTHRQSGLFTFRNSEVIKDKVRAARNPKTKSYNVHDVYHQRGFFQKVAKDPIFENCTLGVIVVNAIWISIDTDYNNGETFLDAGLIFKIVDSLFFFYFSVELFIRFMAFEYKSSCLVDAWFMFDSALVTLYAFDPFGIAIVVYASNSGSLDLPTSVLRLCRLARLSRLVRMLRSLPELMIMIKGIVTATASVSYTLGLLLVITYVFGIALTQLSADKEYGEQFFSSVPMAMYSLIIYATFLDDLAAFADSIKEESTPCLIIVTLFIILASMTVMNMLVGVLCEVISATAQEERESMMSDKVHEKFGQIVKELDANDSGMISWSEFQQIMYHKEAIKALESVNVDPVGMIDFAEDWFQDDLGPKELTFHQFMNMILDMRGGQKAALKDVMSLGKSMTEKFGQLKQKCWTLDDKLSEYARRSGKQHILSPANSGLHGVNSNHTGASSNFSNWNRQHGSQLRR